MPVGNLLNNYVIAFRTYVSYNELKGSILWDAKTERDYLVVLLEARRTYIQAYKKTKGSEPYLDCLPLVLHKVTTIYSQLL